MTNGEKLKEVFPDIQIFNVTENEQREKFIHIRLGGVCQAIELEWWNVEYQEPTTKNDLALIHTEGLDEEIRCTMCTNSMKSDRGCDGSCVVNKDMYKVVMDAIEKRIQPTTKNNLGDEYILRSELMAILSDYYDTTVEYRSMLKEIAALPSVTPQEPKTGYCKDCKWWKDSDGAYRRGVGAESQCPINRREVFEGNGYCYMFEPQESEET